MQYSNYILQSLNVFISSLIIGVTIDSIFEKYSKYNKTLELPLAFVQFIVIITVSYILYKTNFKNGESYTPRVLFSTFLLSLQTNMISNFRKYFSLKQRI